MAPEIGWSTAGSSQSRCDGRGRRSKFCKNAYPAVPEWAALLAVRVPAPVPSSASSGSPRLALCLRSWGMPSA